MNKKRVLVFPCGTEIANEILASLENNKLFKAVFASSEELSFCSFRNQKINFLPYADDGNFLEYLNNLIEKELIEFIVPAHDDVAYSLSELQPFIKAKVIGQSFYFNKIARYKDKTYQLCKEFLPVGEVYESIDEIKKFPIFVKPKKGQGSLNAFPIENINDFEAFISSYDVEDFILMELFSGEEFTIDCFSHNGKLLYCGPRTRDKAINGISVISRIETDKAILKQFEKYASDISSKFSLHGIWFFQMKKNSNGELKLLELAPRVSGTMMVNRAKGINFIELALYQAQGYEVEAVFNNVDVSVARSLVPVYKHSYSFKSLYIDFDDTLFIDEEKINTDLIKLIFQCKNEDKDVYLITKNKKNNLASTLHRFGITNIFKNIVHLTENDCKVDFMLPKSLLIDDSFQERVQVMNKGHSALGVDAIKVLIK